MKYCGSKCFATLHYTVCLADLNYETSFFEKQTRTAGAEKHNENIDNMKTKYRTSAIKTPYTIPIRIFILKKVQQSRKCIFIKEKIHFTHRSDKIVETAAGGGLVNPSTKVVDVAVFS